MSSQARSFVHSSFLCLKLLSFLQVTTSYEAYKTLQLKYNEYKIAYNYLILEPLFPKENAILTTVFTRHERRIRCGGQVSKMYQFPLYADTRRQLY